MSGYQKNVLLIIVDQWRSDCLGTAGHPVIQTPHLDAIASQGTRFTRAYSAVPSCIAARAGLMTGLDQRNHGRVGYQDGVQWNYPLTMAGHLSAQGYHTHAVGKMHVHPARWLCGYNSVTLHDGYLHATRRRQPEQCQEDDYLPDLRRHHGPDADYFDPGPGCNGYSVAPWPYDTMIHPSAWVSTQAVDFLRRRDPTRPFFLTASYHRPHPPFDPPSDYLDIYRGKVMPEPARGDWVGRDGIPARNQNNNWMDSPLNLTGDGVSLARQGYYAQCTFIDLQINRLLHALHEHRVLQDTSIIFVSDHGEMIYDHEMVGKAQPFESSAGVPFIVTPAASLGLPKQQVAAEPIVELRDVFPTVCELAGVPVPSGLDGQSVLPFCRGETPASWRDHLHGEHAGAARANQWIVSGSWKYMWYSQSGAELLFDLGNDPQECRDLSTTHPDKLAEMRSLLIDSLTGREEGYVANGKLVTGRPVQSTLSVASST